MAKKKLTEAEELVIVKKEIIDNVLVRDQLFSEIDAKRRFIDGLDESVKE